MVVVTAAADPYSLEVAPEELAQVSQMSDRALLVKHREILRELSKKEEELADFKGYAEEGGRNAGAGYAAGNSMAFKGNLAAGLVAAIGGMDAESKIDALERNLALVEVEMELRGLGPDRSGSRPRERIYSSPQPPQPAYTIGEDSYTVEKMAQEQGCVGLGNLIETAAGRSLYEVQCGAQVLLFQCEFHNCIEVRQQSVGEARGPGS